MAQQTLNTFNKLRMSFLKKHNYLEQGKPKSGSIDWFKHHQKVETSYLFVDRDNNNVYLGNNICVKLLKTNCNYSGVRYWMECPHCKRSCGVLYKIKEKYFTCLKCLDLPYESQSRSGIYRRIGTFMGTPKFFELEKFILSRNHYKEKMTKKCKLYLKHKAKLNSFLESHAKESNKFIESFEKNISHKMPL